MKFGTKLVTALVAVTLAPAALVGQSATAKKSSSAAKKTAKAPVKKAPAKTATAPSGKASASKSKSKGTASRSAPTKAKASAKRRPRTVGQMQPAPERYKEIQQALFDRGYFMGQVDGSWGPDSTDALKRFQTDQSLDADGKIGALSLIALGLGPRRSAAAKPGAESAPAQESAESPEPVAFPLPPQDAN